MPAPPKNQYETAQRSALLLRGEVIDLFARVEHRVGAVLAHAATLPEYKTLRPTLPHLLGQKLECLRKLISEAGPLKARANGVASLVEKLAPFEELRHFMAHGIVEVALNQSGEPIYVFRMNCNRDGSLSAATLTLTRRKAQSRRDRLANISNALTSKLETITTNKYLRANASLKAPAANACVKK